MVTIFNNVSDSHVLYETTQQLIAVPVQSTTVTGPQYTVDGQICRIQGSGSASDDVIFEFNVFDSPSLVGATTLDRIQYMVDTYYKIVAGGGGLPPTIICNSGVATTCTDVEPETNDTCVTVSEVPFAPNGAYIVQTANNVMHRTDAFIQASRTDCSTIEFTRKAVLGPIPVPIAASSAPCIFSLASFQLIAGNPLSATDAMWADNIFLITAWIAVNNPSDTTIPMLTKVERMVKLSSTAPYTLDETVSRCRVETEYGSDTRISQYTITDTAQVSPPLYCVGINNVSGVALQMYITYEIKRLAY